MCGRGVNSVSSACCAPPTSVHISTVLVGNGRNIGLHKVCLRQLNEKMRAMAGSVQQVYSIYRYTDIYNGVYANSHSYDWTVVLGCSWHLQDGVHTVVAKHFHLPFVRVTVTCRVCVAQWSGGTCYQIKLKPWFCRV